MKLDPSQHPADRVLEAAARAQNLVRIFCGIALCVWLLLEVIDHRHKLDDIGACHRRMHERERELAHRIYKLEHPLKVEQEGDES